MDRSSSRFHSSPRSRTPRPRTRCASCTAAMPTPPAAAWISTRSPGAQTGQMFETEFGGQKRNRERSRFLRRSCPTGRGCTKAALRDNVRGEAAGGDGQHVVAWTQVRHALTDCQDTAGAFAAQRARDLLDTFPSALSTSLKLRPVASTAISTSPGPGAHRAQRLSARIARSIRRSRGLRRNGGRRRRAGFAGGASTGPGQTATCRDRPRSATWAPDPASIQLADQRVDVSGCCTGAQIDAHTAQFRMFDRERLAKPHTAACAGDSARSVRVDLLRAARDDPQPRRRVLGDQRLGQQHRADQRRASRPLLCRRPTRASQSFASSDQA